MTDLEACRAEIDKIDRELVALFERRMAVTEQVGRWKADRGLPVLDPDREARVLEGKRALLTDPALAADVTELFQSIMAISRRQQQRLAAEEVGVGLVCWYGAKATLRHPVARPRVLYQGEPGAYAEEAAALFFGEDCCRDKAHTWEDIFVALRAGEADYGVLPIENSTSGGISQVYDLLAEYGAYIVGEQMVKVEHCLMAPKGASLDTITHVYSHEQGLRQCAGFLKAHPGWETTPRLNTAESAKFVAREGGTSHAAIGSRRAARLYGLEVLAEGISDRTENYTRFVVVSPALELRPGSDKVTALFTLPHRSGSLYQLMTIFAVHGLNMTKLESRPLTGRSWEYGFFVDFNGSLADGGLDGVLGELAQVSDGFRVLGNYKGWEGV